MFGGERMKVKRIDTGMTSKQLLKELEKGKVGGRYTLGTEACKLVEETIPYKLIQAGRAELDVRNQSQKLSDIYPLASAKTIEEIVVALTMVGYILNESRNYSYIRKFLAEEIFGEVYGSNEEYEERVPFNDDRVNDFDAILQDCLTKSEYEIVVDQIFDVCDFEDYDEPEKANWLYELALSKLRADLEEIDWLRTRKVADEYLDFSEERYVTDLEKIVYQNANKDLRRVYKAKKRPYKVSPWRLK